MKKTFVAMCLCTLILCGCNSEPQAMEVETFVMEDTYTIGTTGAELKEIEETFVEEETTVETTSDTTVESTTEVVTETNEVTNENERIAGFYVNVDSPYEQWHFYEDGRAHIAGQELTYETKIIENYFFVILSDGRKFNTVFYYDGRLSLKDADGIITLYEEGSDEVLGAREKLRLYRENEDLFEKFPDENGWIEECCYGDIPDLADAEYIEKSLAEGTFYVSTPEELASFNYYVNTASYNTFQYMQLQNDIDLEGYNWVPMGWSGGNPFCSIVNGNSFSIKNMTIDCNEGSVGFIGWETGCNVQNLKIENARVNGHTEVGILTGQAIGGSYINCHVSGEVNGYRAGSMIGHSANNIISDCTADVIVNGEPFDFLTYNDKAKSEIVIENPVEITIDDTYTVTRPEVEGYTNLGWMIYKDGVQMLHRNAENELSYQYFLQDPGEYKIYLTAFVQGQYVPISNIIEYTIQ